MRSGCDRFMFADIFFCLLVTDEFFSSRRLTYNHADSVGRLYSFFYDSDNVTARTIINENPNVFSYEKRRKSLSDTDAKMIDFFWVGLYAKLEDGVCLCWLRLHLGNNQLDSKTDMALPHEGMPSKLFDRATPEQFQQ